MKALAAIFGFVLLSSAANAQGIIPRDSYGQDAPVGPAVDPDLATPLGKAWILCQANQAVRNQFNPGYEGCVSIRQQWSDLKAAKFQPSASPPADSAAKALINSLVK